MAANARIRCPRTRHHQATTRAVANRAARTAEAARFVIDAPAPKRVSSNAREPAAPTARSKAVPIFRALAASSGSERNATKAAPCAANSSAVVTPQASTNGVSTSSVPIRTYPSARRGTPWSSRPRTSPQHRAGSAPPNTISASQRRRPRAVRARPRSWTAALPRTRPTRIATISGYSPDSRVPSRYGKAPNRTPVKATSQTSLPRKNGAIASRAAFRSPRPFLPWAPASWPSRVSREPRKGCSICTPWS